MATPSPYKKLTGQVGTLTGYHRLWLGPDHILSVESTGYLESYKRFYFAEIQAFIIRKTKLGLIVNVVLGILTVLFAAGAIASSSEIGLVIMFVILLTICISALVVNALLGPTCTCHIKTAIQTERLFSVRRLRTVQKVVDKLRPLIEAQQGLITRDEILDKFYLRKPEPPLVAPGPIGSAKAPANPEPTGGMG